MLRLIFLFFVITVCIFFSKINTLAPIKEVTKKIESKENFQGLRQIIGSEDNMLTEEPEIVNQYKDTTEKTYPSKTDNLYDLASEHQNISLKAKKGTTIATVQQVQQEAVAIHVQGKRKRVEATQQQLIRFVYMDVFGTHPASSKMDELSGLYKDEDQFRSLLQTQFLDMISENVETLESPVLQELYEDADSEVFEATWGSTKFQKYAAVIQLYRRILQRIPTLQELYAQYKVPLSVTHAMLMRINIPPIIINQELTQIKAISNVQFERNIDALKVSCNQAASDKTFKDMVILPPSQFMSQISTITSHTRLPADSVMFSNIQPSLDQTSLIGTLL